MSQKDKIAYFATTDFRNQRTKFGIKNEDRSRHVYVIGKTGMGKSTLLENLAAQDIKNGEGMCFVDPHGSAIDTLIEYVPEERVTDVVYFAPFDTDFPISFNVLEDVKPDERHLVMAGLMATFEKIWPDTFSERMKYILSNVLLALLEYPGATLLGVNRMLADKDYRDAVIANITDSSVKAFWVDEYNKWDVRYAREAGAAIQNKIGQFTSNPLIRNIIGQEKTSFNFREIMDNKKILLVNLSKGRIGESNSNLLGGMLITKLYLAAMSRADAGVHGIKKLPPFFLFVDEFQNFANESFADILAEARKYKLNLTIAHQYIEQMPESVAAAVFGNVGTMITFRVGATDAEVLEKQFAPVFTAEDIVNLGKYQIYLSLMIDGIGSRPFSATTLPPIQPEEISMREHVIANSRYFYSQERHIVEKNIAEWYEPIKKPQKRRITNPEDLVKKGEKRTLKQNKRETTQKKKQENKKGHAQERDFASPLKKVLKEVDEKEAELEMKKVVSPKLHALLENFGKKDAGKDRKKQSKIIHTIENISQKDSYASQKKGEVSDSVKEKIKQLQGISSKNERGAKDETKLSLSALVQKATAEAKAKEKNREKDFSQKKERTKKKKKKARAIDNLIQTTKQISKNQQDKQTQTNKQRKEIPEDVLTQLFQ